MGLVTSTADSRLCYGVTRTVDPEHCNWLVPFQLNWGDPEVLGITICVPDWISSAPISHGVRLVPFGRHCRSKSAGNAWARVPLQGARIELAFGV